MKVRKVVSPGTKWPNKIPGLSVSKPKGTTLCRAYLSKRGRKATVHTEDNTSLTGNITLAEG